MRLLLVDDDEDFTAMLARFLTGDGIEVEAVADPITGLELALSGRFDALVLDVMMQRLDGMELLRRLRRESTLPVLMLTAKGDSVDRVVGLELGADDYLPKPVYPRELLARLRAVMRRFQSEPTLAMQQQDIIVGPLCISPVRRQSTFKDQPLELTGTEFDMLVMLATRPGAVVSRDDLSERVLHRRREPYDRSVDVHVSNLRQKLAVCGGGGQIETVRALGYRLRPVE